MSFKHGIGTFANRGGLLNTILSNLGNFKGFLSKNAKYLHSLITKGAKQLAYTFGHKGITYDTGILPKELPEIEGFTNVIPGLTTVGTPPGYGGIKEFFRTKFSYPNLKMENPESYLGFEVIPNLTKEEERIIQEQQIAAEAAFNKANSAFGETRRGSTIPTKGSNDGGQSLIGIEPELEQEERFTVVGEAELEPGFHTGPYARGLEEVEYEENIIPHTGSRYIEQIEDITPPGRLPTYYPEFIDEKILRVIEERKRKKNAITAGKVALAAGGAGIVGALGAAAGEFTKPGIQYYQNGPEYNKPPSHYQPPSYSEYPNMTEGEFNEMVRMYEEEALENDLDAIRRIYISPAAKELRGRPKGKVQVKKQKKIIPVKKQKKIIPANLGKQKVVTVSKTPISAMQRKVKKAKSKTKGKKKR